MVEKQPKWGKVKKLDAKVTILQKLKNIQQTTITNVTSHCYNEKSLI